MRLATLGGHHVLGDPENTAWCEGQACDLIPEEERDPNFALGAGCDSMRDTVMRRNLELPDLSSGRVQHAHTVLGLAGKEQAAHREPEPTFRVNRQVVWMPARSWDGVFVKLARLRIKSPDLVRGELKKPQVALASKAK